MPVDPFAAQHAEFDTAFNEAASAPAVDPAAPLPYYPHSRYIDRNMAPEKTLTYGDVEALGSAAKLAESTGVLPAGSGPTMLAHAMVEGHPGNYGVNPNSFPATATRLARYKNMGLSVTDLTDPAEQAARQYDSVDYHPETKAPTYYRHSTESVGPVAGIVGGQYQGPSPATTVVRTPFQMPPMGDVVVNRDAQGAKMATYGGVNDPSVSARLVAVQLAENRAKALRAKDTSPDAMSRLYNPNAGNYVGKIQAAREMLGHTSNAPFTGFFTEHYLGGK